MEEGQITLIRSTSCLNYWIYACNSRQLIISIIMWLYHLFSRAKVSTFLVYIFLHSNFHPHIIVLPHAPSWWLMMRFYFITIFFYYNLFTKSRVQRKKMYSILKVTTVIFYLFLWNILFSSVLIINNLVWPDPLNLDLYFYNLYFVNIVIV